MTFQRVTYYCISILAGYILQSGQPAECEPIRTSVKHKGVCWVGGREVVREKEIDALVKNHVKWISQTPFGWQRDATTSTLNTNFTSDRIWWGESDEGISKTTQLALTAGIKTLLKLHLWVRNGWPGDIVNEKRYSLAALV